MGKYVPGNKRLAKLEKKTFGKLLVLGHLGKGIWECQCECGNITTSDTYSLRTGHKKSCGCLPKGSSNYSLNKGLIKTSDNKRSREYRTWGSMLYRCEVETSSQYHNYGGRGIKVCERWKGKEGFLNFLEDMGPRPENMTLDRIDNNLGYSKENCRWANPREQSNNRRTNFIVEFNGEKMSLAELCRKLNLPYNSVSSKLWRGDSLESILHFHKINPYKFG